MKTFFVSIALSLSPVAICATSASAAVDQIMDHNPGNYYQVSSAAYALADAGEYMANSLRYGDSLGYAANNVHMAASRLYHMTSGNFEVGSSQILDHDGDHVPSNIAYAVQAIDQAFANLSYQYRQYPYQDYRIQQMFNNIASRHQALHYALNNCMMPDNVEGQGAEQ